MYARKRFGQHFLRDQMVIDHIIAVIAPHKEDHMIEIGPGRGVLTTLIQHRVKQLDALEIDIDLATSLKNQFQNKKNITIHQVDALKFDFLGVTLPDTHLRIFGNLPYNISTPLLFHCFDHIPYICDMHFMLQKEVAERLAAQPGTKTYGRLSVMAQYYCTIEVLFPVPPQAFSPIPKVDSTFVRLIPHTQQQRALPLFENVVKQAFATRRKTLKNALKAFLTKEDLEKLGINPQKRPEELSVNDYLTITHYLQHTTL